MLYNAFREGLRIIVVGDFDADGATSTALSVLALRSMGAENIGYLVPNRFEDGYGLSPEVVDGNAQSARFGLMMASPAGSGQPRAAKDRRQRSRLCAGGVSASTCIPCSISFRV